jgi:hypothetical protein
MEQQVQPAILAGGYKKMELPFYKK